jgi:hypothetical protein
MFLSDGTTRVHGHVRQYLPCHGEAPARADKDTLRFYQPITLQPGYDYCWETPQHPRRYSASPIMPLLRYIGPRHFVRLLSALLCKRRVILMSNCITQLSACVWGANSILAQGMLAWEHVLIPVLPPRMIQYLGEVDVPYLVGILQPYACRLGTIKGLVDVLCLNVDTNEIKALNMSKPRATVPNMLSKKSRLGVGGVRNIIIWNRMPRRC